jgi:hypothetical protein
MSTQTGGVFIISDLVVFINPVAKPIVLIYFAVSRFFRRNHAVLLEKAASHAPTGA